MRLIKDKIKSPYRLKSIILKLKRRKKTIAFTNGCFDILHYGHVAYLEKVKRLADVLVVAINSDSSLRRIKGKGRPIVNLSNRLAVVAALECVDFVTSFSQDTPLELIKLIKPNFLVKGGDWYKDKIVGRKLVESYGGAVRTLPYIKGQSTSKIIKQIAKAS